MVNSIHINFTHSITIDFLSAYNENEETACKLIQDYSTYKDNLQSEYRNTLVAGEIQLKSENIHVKNELIKNHFVILEDEKHSIYNFVKVEIILKNLPENLLCKKIKNFYAHYHAQSKIRLLRGKPLTENFYWKKNLLLITGDLKFNKKIEFFRKAVFSCKNTECHTPYTFYLINNKTYIFYKNLFFNILEMKNICFFCKKELHEKFEERVTMSHYYYTIFSKNHFFTVKSNEQIENKKSILGFLKREGRKINYINIPYIFTEQEEYIKIDPSPDINSNLTKYAYCLLKGLKENITGNDILLILIFHLYCLSDFSIGIISNDAYYILKMAKHFFHSKNDILITHSMPKAIPNKLLFLSNDIQYLHDNRKNEQLCNLDLYFYIKFTEILNISYDKPDMLYFNFKPDMLCTVKITNAFKDYAHKIYEKYKNSNRSLILLKYLSTVVKNIHKDVDDEIILEYVYRTVINCIM